MANFLTKMKSIPNAVVRAGTACQKSSLSGLAIDKSIRLGGAYGLGVAKGYYREKFEVRGYPADAVIGFGALGLNIASQLFMGGKGGAVLNAASDTALQSYLNSIGTAYGHKKAGRQLYVLQPGAKVPTALPPGMTVAGASDAMGGQFLSPAEVSRFSKAR